MICPNCKSDIKEVTKFCPECGYDLVHKTKHSSETSNRKWYILGAALFALALAWIYSPSNPTNKVDSPQDIAATTVKENKPQPAAPKDNSKSVELNVPFSVEGQGEITILNVYFSDDVFPDSTGMFHSHYAADDGKVYICISAIVKNLQKKATHAGDIINVKVLYDTEEYEYHCSGRIDEYGKLDSFDYIDPLNPEPMKYLAQLPASVQSDNKPLKVQFTMGNNKFTYKLR